MFWGNAFACLLLASSVSAFAGFEQLFEHAFGGGGGFQFQMGGGGRQRTAQLPGSIKNEISKEFEWLKGTEWTMNDRITVKFSVDGYVQTNTQECAGPNQCVYSANNGKIHMAFLQSGLYSLRVEQQPASTDEGDVAKVVISGKRDSDRQNVKLKFVRIYDNRSREDAIDLYAVLGVEPDASTADIKKAFRKLTLELHPDKNPGDAAAAARFTDVTRASEVLSDNKKRMLYDTGGMEAIRAYDRGEVQKGQDVLFEVTVRLSLLFTGGTVTPSYPRRIVCTGCRVDPHKERCKGCSKCPSEIRTVAQQVGPGFFVQQQVKVDSKEWCKTENKALEINVPRGAKAGEDIVMEAMADQSPGMVPGNIVVRLRQAPDSRFTRDGFKKEVALPDDSLIPIVASAVTQPNQVIKIKGEGMPVKDDPSTRGDLYVTVVVELPQSLTNEQKESVAANFQHTTKAVYRTEL